jgi:predicted Zn-dependent protease
MTEDITLAIDTPQGRAWYVAGSAATGTPLYELNGQLVPMNQLPRRNDSALPPRPQLPRSADISAWTAYLHALERYADALEAELKRRPRPPQVKQLALFEEVSHAAK